MSHSISDTRIEKGFHLPGKRHHINYRRRVGISEIRECARPSKGVRIMRVAEGACIVSMVTAPHDDNVETVKPTETEGADEGGDEVAEDGEE